MSGPAQDSPGTSESPALVLPLPPLNDEGILAAHSYLVEIGEATPGAPPTGLEQLQDLCYRLTVELARTRSRLRLEREFTNDALDEVEELKERIEMFSTASGVDEDSILELMHRVELAEDERDALAAMVDWNGLLDD